MLRPPSNPRPIAPLPEQRADGGAAPDPRTGALLAERRTVVVVARVLRAEHVAWRLRGALARCSFPITLRREPLAPGRAPARAAPATGYRERVPGGAA